MKASTCFLPLLVAGITPTSLPAADYMKEILPIMKEHCWECHSKEKSVKGNLDLEPAGLPDQIGKFNIIRPGNPAESGLVERLKLDENHEDFMPRKGKSLSKRNIEAIEKWILDGAVIDAKNPSEEEKSRMSQADPAPEKPAEFQSWTNTQGKTIEARILGIEGKSAKLVLRNGRSYLVPLASLSEESREQARKAFP
ncbi:MAG TPA: hypothetical protein PLA50_07165 [Bacteroidia bacterium]|nr:hypothetical protein [Bacteroidia bacterium]